MGNLHIRWNRRSVLKLTGIVLLLWTPWILMQYPTALNGDTLN